MDSTHKQLLFFFGFVSKKVYRMKRSSLLGCVCEWKRLLGHIHGFIMMDIATLYGTFFFFYYQIHNFLWSMCVCLDPAWACMSAARVVFRRITRETFINITFLCCSLMNGNYVLQTAVWHRYTHMILVFLLDDVKCMMCTRLFLRFFFLHECGCLWMLFNCCV